MTAILNRIANEMIFWMAWIVIPLIMEIIPAILGFFILVKKGMTRRVSIPPERLPEITLIIPVYNSSQTLKGCLESIHHSDYPSERISILLVNNHTKDNSFEIYSACQEEFRALSMQWLNAGQGKSKALNMALFNSAGKYIIHIDSDGKLHPDALRNVVERFEQNADIHCLTGAVLTDAELIEKDGGLGLKLFRRLEMFEYYQAFLAGRNFESEMDSIYTLSGAFSAFRKSTILKTQLYNTETVCEDTHVTFQIRRLLKKKVHLCENAFFFVDPIEGFNRLYTQRQRWQRGELEVSHMFLDSEMKSGRGFFSNFMVRTLMFDHTFAFPRMIWYFALICLAFMNYPIKLIVGSVGIIYFLYVVSAFLYYLNVLTFLKNYKDMKRYYRRKWYLIFLYPFYNFVVFWIRFAGIINSIKSESAWKTSTLTEEKIRFGEVVRQDFRFFTRLLDKLKRIFNQS